MCAWGACIRKLKEWGTILCLDMHHEEGHLLSIWYYISVLGFTRTKMMHHMHYQEYPTARERPREKERVSAIHITWIIYCMKNITKCIRFQRGSCIMFLTILLDSYFDHCLEKSRGKRNTREDTRIHCRVSSSNSIWLG